VGAAGKAEERRGRWRGPLLFVNSYLGLDQSQASDQTRPRWATRPAGRGAQDEEAAPQTQGKRPMLLLP
jgi:hypothetical protein